MSAFYSLLFLVMITLVFLIEFSLNTDLSKEIIETLNQDHANMKNFKENYRRMSCKLLVVAKMRAMFETEEIDKYSNFTTPESRPKFIDRVHEDMLNACMERYKEDKILFEKELFYSYPQDDSQYNRYINVSLSEILEEFPSFNQTDYDLKNKKKKEPKKSRKGRYDEENTENQKEKDDL